MMIKRISLATLKIEDKRICLTDFKGVPILSITGICFCNPVAKFSRVSIVGVTATIHNDSVTSEDNKCDTMIINIMDMINHKLYHDDKIISKEAFLERLFCHIEKFANEY